MILQIVISNKLNPLLPPSIRLSITSNISIEDEIQRIRIIITRPRRHSRITALPAIGVKIMNKASPAIRHEIAQRGVALALVEEGVDGVAEPVEVVEHKRDFLEMRDLDRPGDAGRDGVEAVAEGGDVGRGPGLACEAAVGDEDFVAEIGGAGAVVGAVWCA